jgi:hypothetical protein
MGSARYLQVHRWAGGTSAMTLATCSPQPAQVILPQVLHRTALHMTVSLT